jgi:hypothetical protein
MAIALRCWRSSSSASEGAATSSGTGGAIVFVVRRREDLLGRVIPFFEMSPLLSSKDADFEKFASIVRAMEAGHHRSPAGFMELLETAISMNGNGRFRKYRWLEVLK